LPAISLSIFLERLAATRLVLVHKLLVTQEAIKLSLFLLTAVKSPFALGVPVAAVKPVFTEVAVDLFSPIKSVLQVELFFTLESGRVELVPAQEVVQARMCLQPMAVVELLMKEMVAVVEVMWPRHLILQSEVF
jgi:hypothetical protein